MEATSSTLQEIRAHAEEIGLELIRNNLTSTDPSLSGLCVKLAKFRSLLGSKSVEEQQARQLLRNGFAAVQFAPSRGPVGANAIRLLDALADKLEDMGSFA